LTPEPAQLGSHTLAQSPKQVQQQNKNGFIGDALGQTRQKQAPQKSSGQEPGKRPSQREKGVQQDGLRELAQSLSLAKPHFQKIGRLDETTDTSARPPPSLDNTADATGSAGDPFNDIVALTEGAPPQEQIVIDRFRDQ